jgi:hypothetical protein
MKADDPRLEKSRQQAIARVARVNEMMVTVLKSHIVVEQFMDEFLAVSGRKPKGTFADKAQSCQDLKPPEIEPALWEVLKKANLLRNKIAHTLDHAEIQVKMDGLRAAYLAALSDQPTGQSSDVPLKPRHTRRRRILDLEPALRPVLYGIDRIHPHFRPIRLDFRAPWARQLRAPRSSR